MYTYYVPVPSTVARLLRQARDLSRADHESYVRLRRRLAEYLGPDHPERLEELLRLLRESWRATA